LDSPSYPPEHLGIAELALTLSGASLRCWTLHTTWSISEHLGGTLTPSGASQMRLIHSGSVWSLSDALSQAHVVWSMSNSPSQCLEYPKCVRVAFMPSGVSQMRCNNPHAIWSVTDTLELPSCHLGRLGSPSQRLECPRCIGTALMPSGMLGIAFTLSRVSQTHCDRPHTVWGIWNHLHAVWSDPDWLEPPSCHLRHLGSPSRCLECSRCIHFGYIRLR
jgi:hypothetical protein